MLKNTQSTKQTNLRTFPGEIARCYDENEAVAAFSKNSLGSSLGFVVGPAINFGFTRIDWQLGAWHLTYANFIGMFMAAVFLIVLLIVHFGVHNLSREYDLKAESSQPQSSQRTQLIRNSETPTVISVAKALVCNFDTFSLLLFSFVTSLICYLH